MEMGQPPEVQNADPAMWVQARQYSGRIVTVTNARIFDEPVYNYTKSFPFIWDEMHFPVPYNADRGKAEQIILDAARRHTVKVDEVGEPALRELERRYFVRAEDLNPVVYYRLTDNWLEMSVRFIVRDHGIRYVKDRMSREVLDGFDREGIEIASGTYDIVGMPPLKVVFPNDGDEGTRDGAASDQVRQRERDKNGA
jgi:small-conductance mechanosensitive channel